MSIENKQTTPEKPTEADLDTVFNIVEFTADDMEDTLDVVFPVERGDKTIDTMTLVGLGAHPKTEVAVGKFVGFDAEGKPISKYKPMEQQYALRDRLYAERQEALTEQETVGPQLGGIAISHPEFYDGAAEEHRLTAEQLVAIRADSATNPKSVEAPALSPSVQTEVDDYRTLQKFKREAEADREFAEAGQLREDLFFLLQNMSPQAKQALGLA